VVPSRIPRRAVDKNSEKPVLAPDSYATVDVRKFLTATDYSVVARDFRDPDARDRDDETMNAEYAKDIFEYLLDLEVRLHEVEKINK
jgi:hypothetical protein